MSNRRFDHWSRREFLRDMSVAGVAALLGFSTDGFGAEPPPETTRLRLIRIPSTCHAPEYLAEDLLRDEGFSDVEYVPRASSADIGPTLAAGQADINLNFAGPVLLNLDAGHPIVVLAGVHVGCFDLFGGPGVRAVRDLKGKTVVVEALGSSQHVFLSSMLAYVGVDPRRDVHWVTYPSPQHVELLAAGKVDAVLAFAPWPEEFRDRKVGRLVVDSTTDKPWSYYFCCMLVGNREFVQRHPVAVKRAMRAIFKAANVCTVDPERAARFMVEKGLVRRYDYTVRTIKELPYDRWRTYDPEDTLRFYALRLHEAGMIKNGPEKIIEQGTDWRFLNELKKELKA
ncbi:MAG TPA: ABC transporter substrate-binding protein [Methylomirabilota bacterium]|nr:ABC transporter substrate-binding protein [Methylomirabilota bacterium]